MTSQTDEPATSGSQTPQESQEVTIIALMGLTGTGKTSFINKAAKASLEVGRTLKPCTGDIQSVRFTLHGREIMLIDTPGFDDTKRTDIEILEIIGLHLQRSAKRKMFLTGVIYMHKITDNRVSGSASRSLRILRKLCGVENYAHIALVTSMWDVVSKAEGEDRENELRNSDEYWREMIKHNATVNRHENSHESAIDILKQFLPKPPIVLQFQREFDEHKILGKTSAGMEVFRALLKELEKYEQKLQALTHEHYTAMESIKSLAAEVERLKQDKKEIEKEKEERRKIEAQLSSQLSSQKQIIKNSEIKKGEMEAQMRSLTAQVQELKLDKEKSTREELRLKEEEVKKATKAKDEAERRVQDLQREIEKLKQDKKGEAATQGDSGSNQQAAGEVKIGNDATEGEQLTAQNEVNKELISKEQAAREAQTAIEDAESTLRNLQGEMARIEQDMENERTNIERAAAKDQNLKKQAVENAQAAKINAENEIRALMKRWESLQNNQTEATKALRSKLRQIEKTENAKAKVERDIREIEPDMDQAQMDHERVTNEMSILKEPVQDVIYGPEIPENSRRKRRLRLPDCVNQ